MCVVQFLWDVEAFYDSMGVTRLMEDAAKWGLPVVPSAMAL